MARKSQRGSQSPGKYPPKREVNMLKTLRFSGTLMHQLLKCFCDIILLLSSIKTIATLIFLIILLLWISMIRNLCVFMPPAIIFFLIVDRHGGINVCNDLCVCCANKDETGTDNRACKNVDSEYLKKKFLTILKNKKKVFALSRPGVEPTSAAFTGLSAHLTA